MKKNIAIFFVCLFSLFPGCYLTAGNCVGYILTFDSENIPDFLKNINQNKAYPVLASDIGRTIQTLPWSKAESFNLPTIQNSRGTERVILNDISFIPNEIIPLKCIPLKCSSENNVSIRIENNDAIQTANLNITLDHQHLFYFKTKSYEQKEIDFHLLMIEPGHLENTSVSEPALQEFCIYPHITSAHEEVPYSTFYTSLIPPANKKPVNHAKSTFWYSPVRFLRARLIDWGLHWYARNHPVHQLSVITLKHEASLTWSLDNNLANGQFEVTPLLSGFGGWSIERTEPFDDSLTLKLPLFSKEVLTQGQIYRFNIPSVADNNLEYTCQKELKSCCQNKLNKLSQTKTPESNDLTKIGLGNTFTFHSVDCPKCNKKLALGIPNQAPQDSEGARQQRYGYQLLPTLEHPEIIKLLWSHFEPNIGWFIALDRMDKDIFDFLNEYSAFRTSANIQNIFAAVLRAVHYLHENGYLHLDIKTENILQSDSLSTIKLADFGFLRPISKHGVNILPTPGKKWLAPEFHARIPGNGISQDIWLLGLLIKDLLYSAKLCTSLQKYAGFSPSIFLTMENGIPLLKLCASILRLHPAERPTTATLLTKRPYCDWLVQQKVCSPPPPPPSPEEDNSPETNAESALLPPVNTMPATPPNCCSCIIL